MTNQTNRHVVFLLHGIRTQGEWAQRTASVLERDPSLRARPVRYEFLDVIRFIVPIRRLREQPVRRIARLIRDELSRGPASVSILAHSFGTFIVSRLLEEEPDLRFHRIVLCGSIVRDDFEWERYGHRLAPDEQGDWYVVNDCGMRDIWPVFAKSITWGYGSSGRFGFGHPRVKDRFFDHGHSDFFRESFVEEYWRPYLSDARILDGALDRATTAWWVSVLTVFKIRYVMLALLLVLVAATFEYWEHNVAPRTNSQEVVAMPAATSLKSECAGALTASALREATVIDDNLSKISGSDPTARVLCWRLLESEPQSAEANGLYARALVKEGRFQEARARFERASDLGDPRSLIVLGYLFLFGHDIDRGRLIKQLEEMAQSDLCEAPLVLGFVYDFGPDGSPDYRKAAENYTLASRGSYCVGEASVRLGQLYEWGLGMPQDAARARELYRLGAADGYSAGVEALDAMASSAKTSVELGKDEPAVTVVEEIAPIRDWEPFGLVIATVRKGAVLQCGGSTFRKKWLRLVAYRAGERVDAVISISVVGHVDESTTRQRDVCGAGR